MRRSPEGFTLIELMTTIAVVAVLAVVAVPGMRDFIVNNRLAAQSNDFISTLALARSEAVKRGKPVTVCRSKDGASCGGDWTDGWIMFTDTAATGATPVMGELLRVNGELSGETELTINPDTAYLRYLPSGRLDANDVQVFDLVIPGCSGNQRRSIAVLPTGRAAVSRESCS